MKSVSIMLVDDNELLVRRLGELLEAKGYSVVTFTSGEDAVEFAVNETHLPQFAFVDHVLDSKMIAGESRMDGIECTERLVGIDSDICVVVFSGQAEITANEQRRAIEKGARRYVYKRGGIQIGKDIVSFVSELDELREIRNLAESVREQRELIAATLRELPVGTILVDKKWVVWWANDHWRTIYHVGDPVQFPLNALSARFQDDDFARSLIDGAFDGMETNGVALCKVASRHLAYLHIWAKPICNEEGEVVLCSVSVVDLSESEFIKKISLMERMRLIANAVVQEGYDRVRMYRATPDGTAIVGLVEAGGPVAVEFENFQIPVFKLVHLQECLQRLQPQIVCFDDIDPDYQDPMGKTLDYMVFPLGRFGRLIGWMSVDNEQSGRAVNVGDIFTLTPFAQEAADAIIEAMEVARGQEIRGDRIADVWARIAHCRSPRDAMQYVVEAAVELTGSDSAGIRVRDGNDALLIASVGDYFRHREARIPLDNHYWSVRSIRTGQHFVVQELDRVPRALMAEKDFWTEEAKSEFARFKSFMILPLSFGETFGSFAIHSRQPRHFTATRRAILRKFAELAVMAWIDIARSIERRSVTQRNLALGTVHNLRQPKTVMRGALERLSEAIEKGTLTVELAAETTGIAMRSLERCENIIKGVLRYLKPLRDRRDCVYLAELLDGIIRDFSSSSHGITVSTKVPTDMTISVDTEAFTQCIEEMLSNAVTAGAANINIHAVEEERADQSGDVVEFLRLDIEDDGRGVDIGIEDTMFDPFSCEGKGTGLGLAFVKHVIDEHAGRIWHERPRLHGSKFIFLLPKHVEG